MADIELVIKIPESEIPKQQDIIEIPLHFIDGKVCEAGGYEFDVLPKGHGKLIDADCLREDFKASKKISFAERMDISCIVDHAETIIEADKAESKPCEIWMYPMKGK